MALANTNTLSLFGAVNYNGKYLVENPSRFYQDVSIGNIIYVRMVNIKYKGQPTNAFYILYQQPKSVSASEYLLLTQPNLQNLFEFQAGLSAINSSKNTFTLYNNLIKTSNQPAGYFVGKSYNLLQVLVNDGFTDAVQYLPNYKPTACTAVTINVLNALSKFIIFVSGDQNYAGGSHYFTAYGNV